MTERPIIFSAPMVRAILEGRKTQTRRVLAWKPREDGLNLAFTGLMPGCYSCDNPASGYVLRSRGAGSCWNDRTWPAHCPYGAAGDRLWVRETWQAWRQTNVEYDEWEPETAKDRMRDARIVYRATSDSLGPWRPSIFIPRWASRIALEVADVRVQRLQEISDEDARAEGVEPYTPPHGHISPEQRVPGPGFDRCRLGDQPYRLPFADIWDRINGKSRPMLDDDGRRVLDDSDRPIMVASRSWASNPWVWALTFKRIEGTT